MCVVKAMVCWHTETAARICRERCGGASYLSYNRIGLAISCSHSGMTAEGDNSVLMQKVVKDILTHHRKGKHQMPVLNKDKIQEIATMKEVSDFVVMKTLIYMKEQTEIEHMMKKM